MKTILLFIIASSVSMAHLRGDSKKSHNFAFAKNLESLEQSLWPYNVLSIGHSMQSYQNYSYSPYWHDGLDIRGEAGQKVYASVSGKVVNIENYHAGNHLYWEVAILDDSGFVWKYHHVDSQSIPLAIHNAYKTGTRINRGDHIGNIVSWPASTYGEVYHHIHLLIVDGNGRYVNPFRLLPPLPDSSAPVIEEIGLFNSRRKIVKETVISGNHGLYIKAYDTVLHDSFKLTPYLISYKIDNLPKQTLWRFDYLPSLVNDIDYIGDFYLKGTCGNYRCRNFIINLNFSKGINSKNTKFLNLPRGIHKVEVTISDFAGNNTSQNFNYEVK
jgi:hypothetical protein